MSLSLTECPNFGLEKGVRKVFERVSEECPKSGQKGVR